uniref:DNA ligase (NAD(+)) n=1 Tax=viral metagenome TaxID=1070528 RepID=A0A6C0C8B1_9ZZZZ
MDIIKKINKSQSAIYMVLPSLTVKQLEEVIKLSADSYYNTSKSLVSDEVYDLLVDKLASLSPKSSALTKVGAAIKGKKVKLPYWMGSMNKIKTEKALDTWISSNPGPCLISDKMDGISCLMVTQSGKTQLYTRGDGETGQNISHLLDLINVEIPDTDDKLVLRGELIMTIKNFKKYAHEMSNARNMVAGIVNSKEGSVNKKHARDVDFIAYEIIKPEDMSPSDQMQSLLEYGFMVAPYTTHKKKLDLKKLSEILKKQKDASLYEIDGIIIAVDEPYTRNTSGNPSYAIAYKGTTETASTKVIEVIWKPAKDGHIIPRIHFEQIRLSQANLEYTTGFNARFIDDNLIGPDAIINMTRSGDTIPYIMGVIKPAKKSALPKDLEYEWDETGVNIILTNADQDITVIITRMTKFVTDIGVENMSEKTVARIVEAGFDTIPKIITLTKKDLLELDGFQDKLAEKLINNLQNSLKNLDILKLMVASNCFGRGFGERKIKKILNVYPDIIQKYEPINENKWISLIVNINGFDDTTATSFINSLPEFQALYKKVTKLITIKPYKNVTNIAGKFKDQIIIFSFFREPKWKEYIEAQGGRMGSKASKTTTLFVYADDKAQEAKVIAAKQLGVKTMTRSEFAKVINI